MTSNGVSILKPADALAAKPSLSERAEIADKLLATRYDALNQLIREAELHLKCLKTVHPVSIAYDHDYGDSGRPEQWDVICFDKHGDKWRICHGTDDDFGDHGFRDYKPLVDCPIATRVRAVAQIPKLYEAVVKSKEDFVPEVDAAIKQLTAFCVNC